MSQLSRSPPTVILTLRLWREPLGNDRSEWRGEIKHLATKEVRYFRTWDELPQLVAAMLDDASSATPS
ncbi:MAG: hypothetical protein KDD75_12905 [Caldilineaceae bacterium]|nr:hypothetical protein [Caldilineaceae bacterium]